MDAFFPKHLRPEVLRRDLLPNPEAFDAVRAWYISEAQTSPWCYISGRSRMSKTRAVGAALYPSYGSDVELWSAFELKRRFGNLARNEEGMDDLMYALTECDVLFIDDFGHTLTDSFAENMRLVLEKRGDQGTTIFTSQYSDAEFLKKHTDKQAAAIMGRILDFSEMIDFGGEMGEGFES